METLIVLAGITSAGAAIASVIFALQRAKEIELLYRRTKTERGRERRDQGVFTDSGLKLHTHAEKLDDPDTYPFSVIAGLAWSTVEPKAERELFLSEETLNALLWDDRQQRDLLGEAGTRLAQLFSDRRKSEGGSSSGALAGAR
jgi:hypothetical protein